MHRKSDIVLSITVQISLHLMMNKEKQILIDPFSLKQPTKEDESHCLEDPSVILPITPPKGVEKPLPLQLPRFISSSLPCSVSSSPHLDSVPVKNRSKCRNQSWTMAPLPIRYLSRQRSVALSQLVREQSDYLRRSKSCGEGRASAPSDEFDLCLRKTSNHNVHEQNGGDLGFGCGDDQVAAGKNNEDFKCSALCLFLPGFAGKAKQVKAKRSIVRQGAEDIERQGAEESAVVSRASLEKFECGSWSSSAILNDDEGDDGKRLYFDLPLELIKTSSNDAFSPVATAFVFDTDCHLKSVLKKNPSTRKSHELSARHVQFSTSSPSSSSSSSPRSCITPRLRKAREEFNAYLEEAQRA